ncbi:hypothetical protein K2V58_12015 [Staphylococcus arlettae]|uniref:hypothetical protein n=1 Tax=Staphylococcus arlettae TaxID=29378 RepID=UPI001E289ED8|nr:hypothetical protein [Staphylococcus arlettae]MCD8834999.1 hypothetical protein [Staphylococcus arlettae]
MNKKTTLYSTFLTFFSVLIVLIAFNELLNTFFWYIPGIIIILISLLFSIYAMIRGGWLINLFLACTNLILIVIFSLPLFFEEWRP